MAKSTILKELLKERGLTVQAFADMAGVSKRSLDSYMSGVQEWRSARGEQLLKVADALNVDPHVLVYGRDWKAK